MAKPSRQEMFHFKADLDFGDIQFRGIWPGFNVDIGFEGAGETAQMRGCLISMKSDR